jgi:hypothetical protein
MVGEVIYVLELTVTRMSFPRSRPVFMSDKYPDFIFKQIGIATGFPALISL